MNNENKFRHFFLTTRPYSYAGEIARGIFFGLSVHPQDPVNTIAISAVLSLLMWIYFNWQSDWIQNDPGRIAPPYVLCFSPLAIAVGICLLNGQLLGILGIVVYSMAIVLYSLKTTYKSLGIFGPLLRVASVFGQFIMIITFFNKMPENSLIIIVFFMAFFKGIRNLVGDIRDIRTDKWELPARFGVGATMYVIRISFLLLILLGSMIKETNVSIISIVFAIVSYILLEILAAKFKDKNMYLIGYSGHRFLVITTSVYLIIMAYFSGLSTLGVLILLILLLASYGLYKKIPGKNYKNLSVITNTYNN